MRTWFTLERISNVAFILMCLAVTAVGVQRLTAAPGGRAAAAPPFPAGTRLALHDALRPEPGKASLILALSTNCQFCTASMPFYRRLAALDEVRDGRLKLAVVSLQEPDPMRAYLATHGLNVGAIVMVRDSGVPLQATPTILVVGADGAIVTSASGQLKTDEEAQLIAGVRKASGT